MEGLPALAEAVEDEVLVGRLPQPQRLRAHRVLDWRRAAEALAAAGNDLVRVHQEEDLRRAVGYGQGRIRLRRNEGTSSASRALFQADFTMALFSRSFGLGAIIPGVSR